LKEKVETSSWTPFYAMSAREKEKMGGEQNEIVTSDIFCLAKAVAVDVNSVEQSYAMSLSLESTTQLHQSLFECRLTTKGNGLYGF